MTLTLGLVALATGLALVLVGSVMALGLRATRDVARRLRTTFRVRVAQARGDGPVEVRGRVVPGEQGELTSPLTGRPSVLHRIDATYWEPSSNSFHTFHVHRESRAFLLDDGSGPLARVIYGENGNIMLDTQYLGVAPGLPDPSHLAREIRPEQMAFVPPEALEKARARWGRALENRLRFEECLVEPGQTLSALGPAAWRDRPDGAGRELVLQATGPGDGKLLLLSGDAEERRRHFRARRIVTWILLLLGVLVMLGGGGAVLAGTLA